MAPKSIAKRLTTVKKTKAAVKKAADKKAADKKAADKKAAADKAAADKAAVDKPVILEHAIGEEVLYPCPLCKKNKVSCVNFPCGHMMCEPCYLQFLKASSTPWSCLCGRPIKKGRMDVAVTFKEPV